MTRSCRSSKSSESCVRTVRLWAIEKMSSLASVKDRRPTSPAENRIVSLSPESGSQTRVAQVFVDQESHPGIGPAGLAREAGRFFVPLSLNQRPILGHIVESFENRLQGNLILLGEFFRRERIRTVDGLIDHRRPDSSALEE